MPRAAFDGRTPDEPFLDKTDVVAELAGKRRETRRQRLELSERRGQHRYALGTVRPAALATRPR